MPSITLKLVLLVATSLSTAVGLSIYSTYRFDLQWVRSWLLDTVLQETATLTGTQLVSPPWQADWRTGPFWWTTDLKFVRGSHTIGLSAKRMEVHVLPYWTLPWRFEIHTKDLEGTLEGTLHLPPQPHPKHVLLSKLQPWVEEKLRGSHFEWHLEGSILKVQLSETSSLEMEDYQLVWNGGTKQVHVEGMTTYREPGLALQFKGSWKKEGNQFHLHASRASLAAEGGAFDFEEPFQLKATLEGTGSRLGLQTAMLTTATERLQFAIHRPLEPNSWRLVLTSSEVKGSRWKLPGSLGSLEGMINLSGHAEGNFQRFQVEGTARSPEIAWRLPETEPLVGQVFLHLNGTTLDRFQFSNPLLSFGLDQETEATLHTDTLKASLLSSLQKHSPKTLSSIGIEAEHFTALGFPLEKFHCRLKRQVSSWLASDCTARLHEGNLDFKGSVPEPQGNFRLKARGIQLSQLKQPLPLPSGLTLPKSGSLDVQLFGPATDWTGHVTLKDCKDLQLQPLQASLASIGWNQHQSTTSLTTHFRMQDQHLELFDLTFLRPEGQIKGQWSLTQGKLEGTLHISRSSADLRSLMISPEAQLETFLQIKGSLQEPTVALSQQSSHEEPQGP
jgi:hypothetical protein